MNDLDMADEYPSDVDQQVLDVMRREGRANPKLIRDETGRDKGDVNTVLVRAGRNGDVRQITRGLYEYVGEGRSPDVDAEALQRALDDAEAAADRGDGPGLQDALNRAWGAIEDVE